MYDKESIFAKWMSSELFDDLSLFEITMKEYSNVMARAQMGGSEGIHKPTSGNPRPTSSVVNPPAPFLGIIYL
jgi:hypothetical protein